MFNLQNDEIWNVFSDILQRYGINGDVKFTNASRTLTCLKWKDIRARMKTLFFLCIYYWFFLFGRRSFINIFSVDYIYHIKLYQGPNRYFIRWTQPEWLSHHLKVNEERNFVSLDLTETTPILYLTIYESQTKTAEKYTGSNILKQFLSLNRYIKGFFKYISCIQFTSRLWQINYM